MTDSLNVTDQQAEDVAIAPRVRLEDVTSAIYQRWDFNAGQVVRDFVEEPHRNRVHDSLNVLSICLLVMTNGFTVIGKSAPASPENFNTELGKKFAYEDAVRQLWPLMGYALRDKLAKGGSM